MFSVGFLSYYSHPEPSKNWWRFLSSLFVRDCRTHGITATLQQIRSPKDVDSGVRSACAPPVQLPFLVSLARPRSLISRVSRAPRVSHPRSLPPLSHLGPIAATPSALARVPTPPPASLISLFPLKTHLVPCFAESFAL